MKLKKEELLGVHFLFLPEDRLLEVGVAAVFAGDPLVEEDAEGADPAQELPQLALHREVAVHPVEEEVAKEEGLGGWGDEGPAGGVKGKEGKEDGLFRRQRSGRRKMGDS